MFDVGFWELILIFGVGLMILGPERMPRVAAQIGKWVGRARRTASELRRQLQRELEFEEFKKRAPTNPPVPSGSRPKAPPVSEAVEKDTSKYSGTSNEFNNLKKEPADKNSQATGKNKILSPSSRADQTDFSNQKE